MLGYKDLVDVDELDKFLSSTKSEYGGYGKIPDAYPDLMHSYMGIVSQIIFKDTSFLSSVGLKKIHVNTTKELL
jgi:prenyltransferase beta subunit